MGRVDSMKIYLAARYARKEEMASLTSQIESLGHRVTSRWIHGEPVAASDEMLSGGVRERFAKEDLTDLRAAHICIYFAEAVEPMTGFSRGGKHVELGFALGLNMRVWVVGLRENNFQCLSRIRQFDTWRECAQVLKEEKY